MSDSEVSFILEMRNISKSFGGVHALRDVSLECMPGTVHALVGENGAGKSTVMKAMLGMLKLKNGLVKFNNDEITNMLPQDRVNLGIAFVPQTRNVFTGMTVEENLEMGAFLRTDDIQNTINQVYDLFPVLGKKRNQNVGELSGGQRQQVAFGRALMTLSLIHI